MCNWYLGNYKKVGEKYSRVLTGDAKNETLGPSGHPPMYLSVNSISRAVHAKLYVRVCLNIYSFPKHIFFVFIFDKPTLIHNT